MRLRRERKAPPAVEPSSPETLEGPCPLCDGRGGGQGGVFECITCGDARYIRYPAEWTSDEDEGLRRFVEAGRPLTWIALTLGRPKRAILARLRELGLDDIHEDPSYVSVRPYIPGFPEGGR